MRCGQWRMHTDTADRPDRHYHRHRTHLDHRRSKSARHRHEITANYTMTLVKSVIYLFIRYENEKMNATAAWKSCRKRSGQYWHVMLVLRQAITIEKVAAFRGRRQPRCGDISVAESEIRCRNTGRLRTVAGSEILRRKTCCEKSKSSWSVPAPSDSRLA